MRVLPDQGGRPKIPERLDRTDGGGCNSGVWYWKLTDRKKFYQDLDDRTKGHLGKLVKLAPRQAAFTLDPGDQGRILRWYLPAHDRRSWQSVDTTRPDYLQVKGGLDESSMPYAGAMWYAFELDIPRLPKGQPLRFCVPTIGPQAWVWGNGEYGRPSSLSGAVHPTREPGPVDPPSRPTGQEEPDRRPRWHWHEPHASPRRIHQPRVSGCAE